MWRRAARRSERLSERAWAPSVVTISVDSRRGSAVGTGFVIDEHGVIATNHHVVDGAESIQVKLFDGTKARWFEQWPWRKKFAVDTHGEAVRITLDD